jgi:DNA-binding transcriptional LysR family regulator
MDIQQLKNFSLVAKLGSITRAAELLHVSQPNLSMNIKRLESELGVQLFDRVKTRIIITQEGKLFLDYVDRCLATLEDGIERVTALASAPAKMISIGACDNSWLIPLTEAYFQDLENQPFRAMVLEPDKIVPALLTGEIDFAIGQEGVHPDALEFLPIYSEYLGVLVSKNHPFAKKESVSIGDIKAERLILNINLYPRDYVRSLFLPAGFQPNIVCESNENPIIGPMVEAGYGISLVDVNASDRFQVHNSAANVTLVPFIEDITRDVGVLHTKNSHLPIHLDDLRSAYHDYFAVS